jgi:hypothetical protein
MANCQNRAGHLVVHILQHIARDGFAIPAPPAQVNIDRR